jgi:hypothetical protein
MGTSNILCGLFWMIYSYVWIDLEISSSRFLKLAMTISPLGFSWWSAISWLFNFRQFFSSFVVNSCYFLQWLRLEPLSGSSHFSWVISSTLRFCLPGILSVHRLFDFLIKSSQIFSMALIRTVLSISLSNFINLCIYRFLVRPMHSGRCCRPVFVTLVTIAFSPFFQSLSQSSFSDFFSQW